MGRATGRAGGGKEGYFRKKKGAGRQTLARVRPASKKRRRRAGRDRIGLGKPRGRISLHKTIFLHKNESVQNINTSPEASTVAERAFQQLRRDVLQGVHPPGEKLKLDVLQSHYGFSSSPLREALNRLTQEGLVRSDERRGFRAAPMSAQDIGDITRMRLMLDVSALREAIAHGDDAWESELVAAYHRLERLESRLPDGPVVLDEEWGRRHRDFHMALLAACPSPRQLAWSASLFDQAERYRYLSARHRQSAHRKEEEHRRLMQAVIRRDADTACALLHEHIEGTQRNVLVALRKLGIGT